MTEDAVLRRAARYAQSGAEGLPALRRALARDFADTTKIIVAQRVSSIQNADRILVLEDGRAAGLGTHSELLRSCESYREIAQVQMGEVE